MHTYVLGLYNVFYCVKRINLDPKYEQKADLLKNIITKAEKLNENMKSKRNQISPTTAKKDLKSSKDQIQKPLQINDSEDRQKMKSSKDQFQLMFQINDSEEPPDFLVAPLPTEEDG